MTTTDRRSLANAIRFLAMDAVQKANSGHPGMPMGMADIAEVLWNDFLQHNPSNPHWLNRDRFILSNGHGSMLQYALLHLSGYDVSIDDLKNFRQLHSKTPGHPERGYTPGVETTTGPLGQGLANAVGMALAERSLAAQFNRPGFNIIDHHTYVFAGDGCLMEGISHEVCSLAGTQGLGKLIVFYDDNGISIDGEVHAWFTDNTPQRFESYGWHVIANIDGHDPLAVKKAIAEARSVTDKPSLLCCKTIIGWGAPTLANKEAAHGSPLGDKEIAGTRAQLQWTHEAFVVPAEIANAWNAKNKGQQCEANWQEIFQAYQQKFPELAQELSRRLNKKLPATFTGIAEQLTTQAQQKAETVATRKASQLCLQTFGSVLPELLGGSADLTGSNLTNWSGSTPINPATPAGNYLYYGVREFGMSAIMNGIAAYGGFIPYGGTFLVFADYARNAVRMAALMKQQVIFVFTHDSIGLGEDGPTHQPIEHVNMLRLTPGMSVWRPCDTVETAVAWQHALENHQAPTSLILSRQNLACQTRDAASLASIKRGAYILRDCTGTPEIILIATGSEVAIAVAAYEQLTTAGRAVRVVSMPSANVFDQQDANYREKVLPAAVTKRIAIEAGSTAFWYKYVGLTGKVIGIDSYGESAPAKDLYKHFGITVEDVVKAI